MQVSILTPLFNRLDLTRVFLDSLQRTLRGWRYEVILVDDGSTDGTREFLATLPAPRFRVVLNERGLGYAANNNLAARLAQAPLLCLLNNDTALLPRWFEPMGRLARLLPDVACVGNVQREPASGLVDHYGVFFREDGVPLHAGKNANAAPAEDYLEWPAVTAACCVVRRDVFRRLGGFDEMFRNGLEDVDFCLRAGRQGFRHFVTNRSVIYHHVSASPGRKTHEDANLTRFLERWGGFLAGEGRRRRTAEEARRAGGRYLRKHRWQPWRYNGWRLAQALGQWWSPDPPTRRLDPLPRWWFAWLDTERRRKAEGENRKAEGRRQTKIPDRSRSDRAESGGDGRGPAEQEGVRGVIDAGVPVFLVVGASAQTPARGGVPTVVRCLAGACGRLQAPVRLIGWHAASRSLRVLPPEFSVGLDAEGLRLVGRDGSTARSAPALCDPAGERVEDEFTRVPALHELPAPDRPPPGSWVVLPEVLYGGQTGLLMDYARRHGWRVAVVLHDALAANEPQLFPPEVPNEHARYLQACSRADLVLPVSEFTATDWRTYTAAKGLPPGRVELCQPGADTCVRFLTNGPPPRDPAAPVRLLCVSSVEPRKNHRALLAAYELVVAARPALRVELCLVGANRPGSGEDATIHESMARHPGRVVWYEWTESSTLHQLYLACDFTVYPSVLEGFGLPVVEGLWFKRPCICANFGAMNELAVGGGCITTDVRDPQALADTILSLVDSPERLANLAGEIDRRPLRTWEEYAREFLGLLRGVEAGDK